jgi:hypothetical protein
MSKITFEDKHANMGYCQVGWLYYGFKLNMKKLGSVVLGNDYIHSLQKCDDGERYSMDYEGVLSSDLTDAAEYLTKHYPLPSPYTYQPNEARHENDICVGIEIMALDDKIPHSFILPDHITKILPQEIPEGLPEHWLVSKKPEMYVLQPDCGCCS